MFRASRRADALVFAVVLVGTGWFHQGGGWNQNSRFALVRSIVEDGSFFIDSHLVYERADRASGQLRRVPVVDGNLTREGGQIALAWRGASGALLPIDPEAAGVRRLVAVDDVAASGDVAYFAGHFHPNKAPGTSFAAVPGYAIVRALQWLFGIDPDSWGALTAAAWLTSMLSIGVATALGAVLVLRLGRSLGSELAARLAALAFAFATMAWPYGTMLFEHNLIAVCLLGSLFCIERARSGNGPPHGRRLSAGAGALAGFAAITNYTMAALVPLFGLYLIVRVGRVREPAAFACGVLVPLALILAYNVACFGTPLTTNYAYQSAMFVTESRFLGVFALPRLDVLGLLLFSPFRGLFFSSPVLLASVAALAWLWRTRGQRPLVVLVAAVTAFLLFVNASFNGWDGGWTAVPRYLGPAMGLLALALVVAFDRWRAITSGLMAISVLVQMLLVSVDPQVPIGDVGTAGVPVSDVFMVDPITRYTLPLFVRERPWPLLEEAIEQSAARSAKLAKSLGEAPASIERKASDMRRELRTRIERGEGAPFALAGVTGPVSANPIGIYEGYYYRLFPAGSAEAAGNSFNVGEWIFPQSRLSLLPFMLAVGALLALLFQADDTSGAGEASPPKPGTGTGFMKNPYLSRVSQLPDWRER